MSEAEAIELVLLDHMHEGYFETRDGHRECYCSHVLGPLETYREHLAGALVAARPTEDRADERGEA